MRQGNLGLGSGGSEGDARRLAPAARGRVGVGRTALALTILVAAALPGCAPANEPASQLDEVAWVKVLKARYPQDYAQLRDAVATAPDPSAWATVAGQTLEALVNRQRSKMNTDTARAMFVLRRDQGRALQAVDAAGCAAFMDGQGTPASFSQIVTPQMAKRDHEVMAQLFEQTAIAPAAPPPRLDMDILVQLSLGAMSRFTDSDRNLVIDVLRTARNPATPDEARVMCAYHVALADHLLAMPQSEANPLIWSFLGGGAGEP